MRALLLAASLLAVASPAFAVPFCSGGGTGLQLKYGVLTEEERLSFYEQRLRAAGYDISDARFWNGCIRAFIRDQTGTHMIFFDPDTLAEVPVN